MHIWEGDNVINVNILNCNNIDNGAINIHKGRLNIKYAINGTGKSTISKAIEFSNNQEQLITLKPYKYLSETPIVDEHTPLVASSQDISKVSIFNEETLNQYTFLPDDLLANSFEILIKTADYEARMRTIQVLVQDIQNTFRDNPEFEGLITDLTTFIAGFGNTQNGYSKTGSIGKGLAKGNKIANVPNELLEFKLFIQSDVNASWLSWQSKGVQFHPVAEKCPYCAERLPDEKKSKIQQVIDVYDSKYVSELQKMIGVFQTLTDYFTDDVKEVVARLASNSIEFSQEEINFLKEIKNQVEVLCNKLIDIKALNFGTLKDVDAVLSALQGKKIELGMLSHVDSPYTRERIAIVNNSIDNVITQAGRLQGEINQQKNYIRRTIEKYHTQINGFLESAGYNYQVSILENEDKSTYRMVLMSKDNWSQVKDVKVRLSYGERNAFALVLFMFRAIKEDADLVILDDPISSFDKNKKYAIMEMLFQGAGSLQGKTVLMLTHDFDPLVDLIHTSSIRCRFNPVPVASFLCNQNGQLEEKNINPEDIISFYKIANVNINSDIDEINKMIYLRRRLEAVGDKGLAWQLLSNVFHPDREIPMIQDEYGERSMTVQEITDASAEICREIHSFEYNRVFQRAHNRDDMISVYRNANSGYEKVQIYRIINHGSIADTIFKKFIDEAYHIENDSLFQLNPTDFSTVPEYIIDICDREINNM